MGTAAHRECGLPDTLDVQVVETWILCRTGHENGLYSCWSGPSFHKLRAQFTGPPGLPVQDVGKRGHEVVSSDGFSIPPDLHSPVLENAAADEPLHYEEVHLLFHFSCLNYGDYGLCISINH